MIRTVLCTLSAARMQSVAHEMFVVELNANELGKQPS